MIKAQEEQNRVNNQMLQSLTKMQNQLKKKKKEDECKDFKERSQGSRKSSVDSTSPR
jgi:hypothetical protein